MVEQVKRRKIRVLLIEDDKDDCILIRGLLSEVTSNQYEITWTPTYEEGVRELDSGSYDICLLDYRLGTRSGLDILVTVGECPERPPIIVLTGHGDYRIDVEAMKSGAADYLVKDQINEHLIERSIRYAMDRKKSNDELRESEKQLKHLSAQLLVVQENERRKIAAELHDDLGQLLTAFKFNIENVLTRMDPEDSRAAELRSLIPKIQGAVERVRNMYTQLTPTALYDLGITATLNWYCREFESRNPEIEVDRDFELLEEDIPTELKLVIFRIVQEAMENVAAHSRADSASLSLVRQDGLLRLNIGDDGEGFDVAQAMSLAGDSAGLGLMSMKRRAELSGGSIQIESGEGSGTLVRVVWPIGDEG
ncbi:MAG: response regulator [Syntrophobacteraceae bacterium]